MQEQFPARAYMYNIPKNEDRVRGMTRYAENAGAILSPWMACMPKMQEQFSAGAYVHTIPKNEACCV